jgi:hypothetical protein
MATKPIAASIGIFLTGLLVGGGVIFAITRPTQQSPAAALGTASPTGLDAGLNPLGAGFGGGGAQMNFRGDWDSGVGYLTGDVVTFKGAAYVASDETKDEPPGGAWVLLVDAGQGPEGPQGVAGVPGASGPPGASGGPGASGVPGATGADGQTGTKGDKGDTGIQGAPGPTGARGRDGASGPSALFGRVEGASIWVSCYPNCTGQQLNGVFKYAAPSGTSTYVGPVDEALVTQLSPAAEMTARDLFVKAGISGKNSDGATFTLRVNGSSTALTCFMPSTSTSNVTQTCTGFAAVTIPPGSELSLEVNVKQSALLKTPILFGWRAANP